MGVEHVGGPGQGAGAPPGVVVAEGDIGGTRSAYAQIAADRAEIVAEGDHLDVRKSRPDRVGGAVGGTVVDQHHVRPLGQFAQPSHAGQRLLAPLPGDDDDAHS
jgi:hypothetical protein